MPATKSKMSGALLAAAAGALVLAGPAAATPVGPCEEMLYVGACVPVGGQATTVQQPYGEHATLPNTGSNPNTIG